MQPPTTFPVGRGVLGGAGARPLALLLAVRGASDGPSLGLLVAMVPSLPSSSLCDAGAEEEDEGASGRTRSALPKPNSRPVGTSRLAFVAVRGACFSSWAGVEAEDDEGVPQNGGGGCLLGTGGGALTALPQSPSAGLAALVTLAGADGLGGADAEDDTVVVLLMEEVDEEGVGVSAALGGSCFDADTSDDAPFLTPVRSKSIPSRSPKSSPPAPGDVVATNPAAATGEEMGGASPLSRAKCAWMGAAGLARRARPWFRMAMAASVRPVCCVACVPCE